MDTLGQRMEKARVVTWRYESSWFEISEVVSVGVGLSRDNAPAIIVGVKEKSPTVLQRIPTEVDGFPVLLVRTGNLNAK